MKTVGITTTTYGNNFGEALQAYAIRRAINQYCPDCQAELVNFICKNQTSLTKPGFQQYVPMLEQKNTIFNEFRSSEIELPGNPVRVITAENTPEFDRYVFGSDQIWNTQAWKIPEFFGSFVPEGKPKIAYAASVGLKPNDKNLDRSLFEQYIHTFSALSVREKIHCDFIQQFTSVPVHHVADPTMLIDAEEYRKLFSNVDVPLPNKKYVFYYQPHSADGAIVNFVNKMARIHDFDVVHTFADIPINIFPYDSISARFYGPREFLFYIDHADLVVTRSYHAVVFSILFRKPFYAYVDKKSGSRFESLLSTLGLEDRLVYDYIKPENANLEIDYDSVYKKLSAFKESSIAFLKTAIE